MLPTKFRFIWPSGFREEDFFKSSNQKQELPVVAMFVNVVLFLFIPVSCFEDYFYLSLSAVLRTIFSSPCQRQCELFPSLGIRRLLTFHILIFSSETSRPDPLTNMATTKE
jgi:hypothetical protein